MRGLLMVVSLWLTSAHSFAEKISQPTPFAFGRAPAMESLALSPNGNLVAWIANSGARPVLQVLDLGTNKAVQAVNIPGDITVRRLDWADDQVLLIHSFVWQNSADRSASAPNPYRTVAMEVATGKSRVLTFTGGDSESQADTRLLALHPNKPHHIITSFNGSVLYIPTAERTEGAPPNGTGCDWSLHVYAVDTLTGAGRLIQCGQRGTTGWVVDANGKAVARSAADKWQVYSVLHQRASGWAEVFRLTTGEKPELLGLTSDGSALLMRGRLTGQAEAVWRVSLNDSTIRRVLGDGLQDVTKIVRDPYSRQVLGAWTDGLMPHILWMDEQAEKRAASLAKTFGGKQVELIGRSADGERALVGVSSHAAPVTFYLVDFKRGTADIIGEQYPELVNTTLGEVRALMFKARDGYEIPAYLTLPPHSQNVKLPLVVLPHDGPDARDETKFDPLAQFLATRGYAVLQPQFRGSTGFGEAHRKAGDRQWGGLMQNDLTDGVRAMVDLGIADAARVCIAGKGYGGYAALAGVAFTPGSYACAISVNGMADLPDLMSHVRRHRWMIKGLEEYFEEHLGTRSEMAARSPARAASNVKVPVLLMHGVDTPVVPVAQSRAMMKALGGQAPHELIELHGEAEWASSSETRTRVLTEMERFLAKHLPVAGASGN